MTRRITIALSDDEYAALDAAAAGSAAKTPYRFVKDAVLVAVRHPVQLPNPVTSPSPAVAPAGVEKSLARILSSSQSTGDQLKTMTGAITQIAVAQDQLADQQRAINAMLATVFESAGQ